MMVSPPSFRIWPETSGLIDCFLSIAANLLLMILVLIAKGSYELAD
jgi:hypothetical protein